MMNNMENWAAVEVDYKTPEQVNGFSLQEKVLARGMYLKRNDAVYDYTMGNDGVKRINDNFTETDFGNLANEFRDNPREALIFAENNILSIMRDGRLSEHDRVDRVKRYTDAYIGLMVKLDRKAYAPYEDKVYKAIPNYVPDGLSDMGSDPDLNDLNRNRERIRVDKENMLKGAKSLLYEIFTKREFTDAHDIRFQRTAVEKVANYVYENIKYDYSNEAIPFNFGKSISGSHFSDRKLGVCRHQAMLTQVLLQALGVDVRLMKSNVSFRGEAPGSHACNLVKIENDRYLLDVTNPEFIPDKGRKIYVRKVSTEPINLNINNYIWTFNNADGTRRTYQTRNNMYFRIRDNVKNPVNKVQFS